MADRSVATYSPRSRVHLALRGAVVRVRHLGIREDDVVVAQYPKSGSTWLRFVLGELLTGRSIDFENADALMPPVGRHRRAPALLQGGGRVLKTHEPYRREYRRAVYLVRHVADVAVSYHGWLGWRNVEVPDLKSFLPRFLRGELDPYGPWSQHVESWIGRRQIPLLVVRYEDLKADTEAEVARIMRFLGVAPDRERILDAIERNTLERMREKENHARATVFRDRNPHANFVRKGVVGDSANRLDEDDLELVRQHAGEVLKRLGYRVRTAP